MKSTKKALLLSMMSMLLCVAMLIGTTFAWFTDSVTSGVNTITAGNLDIELEYSKDGTDWNLVQGTTELFSDVTLWEPGATSVVYLKLTNKGTLALKYNLAITATGGEFENVAGETKNLKDALKFAQVAGPNLTTYATRDLAVAATTSVALGLSDYAQANHMAANDVSYITLVVTMPTTVGNDFNYKTGTPAPEIKLGINLNAYQYSSETDSFDKYYDLMVEPVDVYTEEEFTKAVAKAKAGVNTEITVKTPDLTLTVAYTEAKTITLKGEKITKLIANAPNGEIHVWNEVGTVEGTVVAMNSAHLYGKVQTLDATKGHFVVEEEAEVENIQTTEAAVAETLKIEVLGKVNTLTTEKGTIEIGSTAKVENVVATANTTDDLVIKVAENAEVTKIATPAEETAKSVSLQIEGKVETLDVPKVNDNIIVKVASTGVVEEVKLAEEETEPLQIKNEGSIKNAGDLVKKIVEPYAAKIGENKYASLTEAINAAKDRDVVVLLNDIEENINVKERDIPLTIDFNGKWLKGKLSVEKSVVTLKDTTGKGGITGVGTMIYAKNESVITVDSGNYIATRTDTASYVKAINLESSEMIVNNGKFSNEAPSDKGYYCYLFSLNYGWYKNLDDLSRNYYKGSKVTVNGGDFTAKTTSSYGYIFECSNNNYWAEQDPTTINAVVINGGSFETAGSYGYLTSGVVNAVVNDCTFVGNCAGVFSLSSSDSSYNFKILVNGGNYTIKTRMSTWNIPLGSFAGSYPTDNAPVGKVELRGGTINSYICDGSKIDGRNSVDLVADGYHVVDNGNGTKSVVAD